MARKNTGLRAQLDQISTADLIRLWVHSTGLVPELQLAQSLQQFASKMETRRNKRAIEGMLLAVIDRRLEEDSKLSGQGGSNMRRPRCMRYTDA